MKDISDAAIIEAVQAALPDAQALFLFGSRADGSHGGDSDLDLAVLLPTRPDPVRLWEAGEAVARRLNTHVDLVDLRAASTVMQHQIITTGRRLFALNGDAERYELFILSEMIDFDHARAPLIADIQREGRVHGR
ncbi:putative DNA polymerase subunit beta [Magnetospirillum sp. XM-1]|uniref:type VII toxin-antitoxin system MntA family adenylyltransferase antitoxin n=1 Tax=Magnetospirillum sp. XM-1 TaxID=1663591 RepID=UPI00073DC5BE|nr:nucleotidyltransferase domain-containing protein [Magnetospirillum sp. XM-1]CUW39973.1 putative DNA polymerase subunit beta [Magnetospirillum sp. XM-1]